MGKVSSPKELGSEQDPQGMVTFPRTTLLGMHRVGFLGFVQVGFMMLPTQDFLQFPKCHTQLLCPVLLFCSP